MLTVCLFALIATGEWTINTQCRLKSTRSPGKLDNVRLATKANKEYRKAMTLPLPQPYRNASSDVFFLDRHTHLLLTVAKCTKKGISHTSEMFFCQFECVWPFARKHFTKQLTRSRYYADLVLEGGSSTPCIRCSCVFFCAERERSRRCDALPCQSVGLQHDTVPGRFRESTHRGTEGVPRAVVLTHGKQVTDICRIYPVRLATGKHLISLVSG